MTISTTARRTARTKGIDTQMEDLVIDLEDACVHLPLAEQEKLIDRVRAALAGVTADPAGIASGRVPIALGAGAPAPTTAPSAPIDPQQAIIDYAASKGYDPAKLAQLFGGIDNQSKLDIAIRAVLGQMVSKTDLDKANDKVSERDTRLTEIATELGVTSDLMATDWKAKLATAINAKIAAATPATAGVTPADKAMIVKVQAAIGNSTRTTLSAKKRVVEIDDQTVNDFVGIRVP